MDGILNINKPAGMTSHDVVARIRRLSGQKKTGHAGTLDPEATGVLPVCLGQATRIIEFLMDSTKVYRAVIELGITTDSYDAAGQVTRTADCSGITRDGIETTLHQFRGTIDQTPPMFSALKHQGQPLYRLARAGITVERASRQVIIHRLDIIDFRTPRLMLEIECSKGTYIRSLAHDLGEALGCGAHLQQLERTRNGDFDISDAVTLPRLEQAFEDGSITELLSPADSVLQHLVRVDADEAMADAIVKGQAITLDSTGAAAGEYRRAYGPGGCFLAILIWQEDEAAWRPKKVFRACPGERRS